jgi:hypothetical protein
MINRPLTGGYGCVDTGTGFFSTAIKMLTHSPVSHAFIVLNSKTGDILEAEPNGTKVGNLSEYVHRELVFSTDTVLSDKVSMIQMVAFAKSLVGTPYGFSDILYLGMELTLGPERSPKWLLNQVIDESSMICSQEVAHFGAHFGVNWNCGQKYDQLVTPAMLFNRAIGS